MKANLTTADRHFGKADRPILPSAVNMPGTFLAWLRNPPRLNAVIYSIGGRPNLSYSVQESPKMAIGYGELIVGDL